MVVNAVSCQHATVPGIVDDILRVVVPVVWNEWGETERSERAPQLTVDSQNRHDAHVDRGHPYPRRHGRLAVLSKGCEQEDAEGTHLLDCFFTKINHGRFSAGAK